jgi:16S rRNA (cytidine1402-2'-O)-methyltransferase
MATGKLYLIPSFLGESPADQVFPIRNAHLVALLTDFIVEDERTARRFLKKINPYIDISLLTFHLLNEHTDDKDISSYLDATTAGRSMGLISEAGMPCVADPGAAIVCMAHEKGISVVPLTGPSSIFLALAASGFNGQNFCFHGYLPKDKNERGKKIKELERFAHSLNQTQIFIETPYRNHVMFDALMNYCNPSTLLCIAADITTESEFIRTQTISAWKKQVPDLDKRPAVFLLYHK